MRILFNYVNCNGERFVLNFVIIIDNSNRFILKSSDVKAPPSFYSSRRLFRLDVLFHGV